MDTQAEPATAPFDESLPPKPQPLPPGHLTDQQAAAAHTVELAQDNPGSCDASRAELEQDDGRPAILNLIEAAIGVDKRPDNLVTTIESLLFVAEEPPSVQKLAEATNVSKDAVEDALEQIERESATRGIRLQRNGPKLRLVSAPESAPWIERLLGLERPNKLSKASLETLAIVAYCQPITRVGVEKVRGVSCDGPFQTLRSRDLIEPVGLADGPGRPILWAVTDRFLDHFSLRTLSELPPLPLLRKQPAEQRKLQISETDAGDDAQHPLAAAGGSGD